MEPILVPGPPKEAFNKHRHISDLVRKQVEHFKRIEEKLPVNVRATLPQHQIVSENEAARYIGAMTSYLLSRPKPKQAAKKTVAIRPGRPLTLAAAAAPVRKKSTAKKKSAPKKETPAARKSLSTRTKAKAKAKKSKPKAKKSSAKRKK